MGAWTLPPSAAVRHLTPSAPCVGPAQGLGEVLRRLEKKVDAVASLLDQASWLAVNRRGCSMREAAAQCVGYPARHLCAVIAWLLVCWGHCGEERGRLVGHRRAEGADAYSAASHRCSGWRTHPAAVLEGVPNGGCSQ